MTSKSKKIVLGVIAGLVALIAILAVVAPKQMHVEQSIVIAKPVPEVFAYIRNLKSGEEWSPWNKMDPSMVQTYSGTDGQVGAIATWSGNANVGEGEQEIKSITGNQRIDYELRFKKPMTGVATASLATESVDANSTKVTWVFDSESKFPMNVIGLLIDCHGMMNDIFAEGLGNLKTVLEK